MKKNAERWTTIVGYPKYEVSDHGRVRSLIHFDLNGVPRLLALIPCSKKKGVAKYLMVGLVRNGVKENRMIHRLVLEHFVGPAPTPRHQGAHNDGDGFNNYWENLRWATQAENEADKVLHGTAATGVSHGKSVLTEAQVREILSVKKWEVGMVKEFAEKFGVKAGAISKIKTGIRWKSLKL
ncbi:HNH endonuclease [Pseudomonas phage hairong]|nr:HNH endonuclease [Pseudomonas phage hairong]